MQIFQPICRVLNEGCLFFSSVHFYLVSNTNLDRNLSSDSQLDSKFRQNILQWTGLLSEASPKSFHEVLCLERFHTPCATRDGPFFCGLSLLAHLSQFPLCPHLSLLSLSPLPHLSSFNPSPYEQREPFFYWDSF